MGTGVRAPGWGVGAIEGSICGEVSLPENRDDRAGNRKIT